MDPRITTAVFENKQTKSELDPELLAAYEAGTESLATVLGFDGSDIAEFKMKGLALFEAGCVDKARSVFEMVLELGADDPAIRLVLAGCCHILEDRAAAVRHLEKAIHLLETEEEPELLETAEAWSETILSVAK